MLALVLATDKNLEMPSFEKTSSLIPSGGWSGAERAARGLAATKGGLPSIVGNMGIRSGAGLGALAGVAYGAANPGKDDEGNERGIISGAARGLTRGALLGGGLGGLTRHVAAPTINQHLPAARAELKAAEAEPVVEPAKVAEAPKETTKISAAGIKVPVLSIRG